jgi:Domain of unknown function (DUF4157)
MKRSLQPTHQPPQKSVADSAARRSGQGAVDVRTRGNLDSLAATMNASQRVQTQLKLASQLNQGASTAQRAGAGKDKDKKVLSKKDKEKSKLKKADPSKPQAPAAQRMPAQLEEAPAPDRTGLPDQLKSGVESLSGVSLDDVRVHYNSPKPAQLNALAYAQGTDIHVAPGQEKHLPHEAWHIVQQKQGRVQPTTQMKAGVPVNDDPKLEHEADVMGAKAAQRIEKHPPLQKAETDSHGEGCACPACSGARQLMSRDPAQLMAFGHGVAQLECAFCKSLGEDSDHSPRKCPYVVEEEVASAPAEPVAEEGQEKVPGWKKQSGGPTGRISRSGISHHDIGKDKSKSKKERDMTGGRKGKKKVYKNNLTGITYARGIPTHDRP